MPQTSDMAINRRTGTLILQDHSFEAVFGMNGQSYDEKLIEFLEKGAGYLAALASAGLPLQLLLSGGYDSRLVLGLLLASNQSNKLRITSYPHKENDFQAATSICKTLNLPLNTNAPAKPGTLSSGESFRMWMLSCGGNYLPVYPVRNTELSRNVEIRLTGDQPTGWDHFAGNAPFNGTANKISDDIRKALANRPFGMDVADDFLSFFQRSGIDPKHPKAMLAHYGAVRSRHHCGRAWYKTLGREQLFTPLMQRDMVALCYHDKRQDNSDIRIFADAFSALGGWTLTEPFETPDRQFPKEMLQNSPFKGGVKITPRKVSVFGFGISNRVSEPNLRSIPLPLAHSETSFKKHISAGLWATKLTRQSKLFSNSDFVAANLEISQNGTLSHGFRKTTLIVMTEAIMEIIAGSGR